MSSSPQSVLVTGATGNIGRQVVRMLADAGEPVRALCRRQQQVDDFRSQGVTAVRGDLSDPESLMAAMKGVDRLFLLTFPGPSQREHGRNAVEAALATGVRRVVHLSTADANPASAIPWASAPAYTDTLLQATDLEWTSLRPAAFMQNVLESAPAIRRGLLPQTSRRGVTGWIDTQDIAAVAAQVLAEEGHGGATYVLTGPELLSVPDLAAQLTTVLGRRVRYVHLPSRLFHVLLRLTGSDPFTAEGLRHQFADVLRHGRDDAAVFTETVRSLTGAAPRSFTDFADAHRDTLAARRR